MPFIADEGLPAPGAAPVALPQGYAATPEAPTDAETRPSLGETFGSAFSLENEVVGAIKSMDRESNFGDWDDAHNPWDTIRGTDLEPYHGAFVGSRNQKETDHISGLIRKEMEHRKVLERSNPALAFGAMGVASILSPTTLIPGGTIYRGLKAGRAAAKSAAAVGAANAAAAGIQEGILHSQQYTRTLEESGLAIGGSFLLAGILGGAVGGLSSAKFAKLTRTLENDLNIAPRFEEAMAARMAGEGMEAASVGAATTAKPAADLSSAFGLEKTIVKVDPVGRTMNAASPAAREIETMLAELPMQLTRNAEGFTTAPRGGSVETRIKTQGVALEGQALHGLHRHWAEYRFGNPDEKLTGFKSLMKRDPAKLSEKDFNVEVGKAMARGDEHTIPEVAAAAKHIRKTLIDPLADSAVKYKLLSADVVKRGRPKGAQTQGSQVPTPPPAAPVMAGNIDALLRQIEDVSGQKIDPAMRNGIVDTVAANEDLVRQLRELASGEADIPFAMRDAAPIGRTIDDVVDDLEDGYPVMVERAVVDRVMEAVTDYRVGLPDAARSVPMHVMVGVVPAGDGMVSASFRGLDGGFRSVDLRLDDFRRARAFSLDGGVFLPAVGFSGKLLHRLRGEIGHELVHALRLSEGIEAVVFARLVAHAESLKVLDMSLGDMMRVLGESSVTTKPLREVYQTAYAYAKGDDVLMRELLGQEAIAHMVELRHHGALSDEQLAPVLDDMDRLFGRPVENGHQAVVRRWVDDVRDMVDVRQDGSIAPMLAVRDDGDALRKLAEHIDGIIGRNGEGTSGGGRDAGVGADTAGAGDGVVGHRFKVDPVLRARAIEALIPERYGSDVVAARAKIQGWNVTGYHGTNTAAFDVPDAFVAGRDFGFHVAIDAPKAANSRLGYPQTLGEKLNDSLERLLSAAPSRPRPQDGGAVIPLKLRVSNPLELPDIALARNAIVGNWTDPVAWQSILKKVDAPQELVAFVDKWIVTHRVANNRAIINKHNFSRAIAKKLSDLGFDAVTYKNAVESAGSRSMFVWDASRIRSAFDMFDDRAIDDVGLHASARYVMADVKERLNAFMRERGISEQPLFAMSDAETGRSMRLRDYLQSMFRSIVYHGEASAVGTPPDVGMSAAASGRMAQGSVDDLVFRLSPTNDRAVMDDYERAAARQTQSEMKPELSTVDGGKSVVAMTALFLERGFKRSDGSSITVENAYKHYADWASKNGLSQLTLDKFREAMHHVGFVSQRIAARDRYVGVDVADNSKNIPLFAMRDIDMSVEARKARAEAMGFDTGRVWYHGTRKGANIASFDLDMAGVSGGDVVDGVWLTSDWSQADRYGRMAHAKSKRGDFSPQTIGRFKSDVLDLYAPREDMLHVYDVGGEARRLINDGYGETYSEVMGNMTDWLPPVVAEAKRNGKKGVVLRGIEDDPLTGWGYTFPADHIFIFDPRNIRSVNAAFDPAKSDSANLMFAMRDLAQRINAPLIDDMAKSDPHPGRVMAIHGTKAPVDFAKFDPEKSADFGVHFGTKDQAEIPSGMTTTRENARMIPVVLDLKTVVDVPDLMTWPVTEVAEAIEKSYPLAGGMTDRVRAVINAGTRDVGPTGSTRPSREALAAGKAELRRLMSEAKIDGLRYWNESEGDGWSYIVWDEGKVTSAITGQPMLAARGDDVLKKIRSLGGIKDATGDLKAMGAGERSGIINNDRGLSPDAMREHLVQAGYLQDVKYEDVTQSSVNDLYDLVSEALSSEKGPGRAYRDEMAFHALQSARKMFEDTIGIELKLTPEQERQIVGYILDQRMSVSDALERFGMAGPEPAAKAGASSDPVRPARAARFLDEMRERAEEAGFGGNGRDGFSDDVADEVWKDGGQTYITRLYNRVKIASQRPQFKALISDYFEQSQQRANAVLIRKQRELADAEASGAKIKADDLKDIDDLRAFTGLSRQELEDSANTVIDHILGHPEGRLLFDLPAAVRGPLKARTLRIPDSFESAAGKFEDFLDRDISTIARFYTRTMVPDIEATRMFGSLDMKEQLARIGDDYKKMSESPELDKMPPQKAEQTRRQLQRERERVERDLLAQMDRLRGTYALPDDPMAWGPRAVRAVKTWNMTRMLGGMTISAVPDIFRPMMVHGVMSYFGDGIRPLFGGLKAMKLAGDEVRLAGTAWDMVLSSRAHAIADVLDDYGRYSKFERGLGWVQDKFGVLSLMNQWNTAVKQWSGMITMNNVLKASQSVASGSASKADIRKLASSGIDSFDARIIAEQFAKHGVVEDGVYLANSLKWDVSNPNVRNALESFRGAVVRDVDRIIVTPGQDKPLWMSTQLGSMVGQFKSFGVASMQRTLVAGLQQRDAGVVMGALLMIGMGGVVEYFKSLTNDKPLPKTEAQWVAAAVDRAGLIGWLSDANNFVEKFSGGTLGVGALTGKELSRFASRNLVDAVMGPTAGTITDLGVASSGFARAAAGKDDLREADIAALRRLIPMQNLFYLSYIFQKLEQAVSDGVGARPGSRGSRLRDRISMNEGWLDEFAGAA